MRKIIVFAISSIIIFSVVVQAQTQFATILKKSGVVNIRPKGETDFSIPAEVSMGLNIGDALKTYEAGYAALLFSDDKSLIKIRKNSEMEIREEFSVRTIKISEGRLLAKITPGITTSYRIATPTSVASVKGTEFWVVTSPDYGDRFYGIEGLVQVINLISGLESMLDAGQMIISTLDGQLLNIPIEPEDMPVDIEEEAPPPDIEEEVTPPELEEEVFVPGEEVTVPPTAEMAAITEEEVPPEPAAKKASKPYGMGLGLGSVTIDGVIYNQIALRPEVKFGKLGVGLDVVLYMDDKGKIRENEWDEFSDYLDKIYYLRWAQQGDPFFAKAGALDNVTLGYGILMNGYSNTTEYPQIRKVGVHTGMQFNELGWEAFTANIKEITGPGLIAGRVTYKPIRKLPLTIGGSVVMDVYPYLGLPDSDDDEVPDALDLYKDADDNKLLDSLGSEFNANQRQFLRDNGFNIPSEEVIENGITKLGEYDRILNGAISFDVGYPIFKSRFIDLFAYGQVASFFPFEDTSYCDNSYKAFTPGWGIAAPGLRAQIFKMVNLCLEYRYSGSNFLYSFWDRTYDFERVQIRKNRIFTKQQMSLYREGTMQGVFGSLNVNILNYVILGSYYQHMMTDSEEIKSFMATASIPKGKIPKLANATAFYQRNNDENPFNFKNPSENTILGYRIGFELGGGAVLSYVFQTTYRDLNGDGKIDHETESITLTTIETGFNF